MTLDATKKGQLRINGVVHKGRVFQIADRDVELFRIGTLAQALDKSTQALVLWEREGLLPKSMYTLKGLAVGHCHRWYSKEQIVNLYHLWQLIPYGRGRGDLKTAFFKTLQRTRLFYRTTIVTLKQEHTHELRQQVRQAPVRRPAPPGVPRIPHRQQRGLERAVIRPHGPA